MIVFVCGLGENVMNDARTSLTYDRLVILSTSNIDRASTFDMAYIWDQSTKSIDSRES